MNVKIVEVKSNDSEKRTNLQHRIGAGDPPAITLFEDKSGNRVQFKNTDLLAVEDAQIKASTGDKYWKLVSTARINQKNNYKADARPAGWPTQAFVKANDTKEVGVANV